MNTATTAVIVSILVSLVSGCTRINSVSLTHPIGTRATMVDRPFENPGRILTAMVYVENPLVVLDTTKDDLNPRYTFFNWFYDSFAIFGTGINLVVHSMMAEEAGREGISTASVVYGNTFLAKKGSYIEHMSFEETDISKLIAIGARVGATHIIKARWISGRRWTERVTRRSESQGLKIGTLTFGEGAATTTTTANITFSAAIIECTAYGVATQRRLFSREFEFYEEEVIGADRGFRRIGKINHSMVESILSEVMQTSGPSGVPQAERVPIVQVGRSESVSFPIYEGSRPRGTYTARPTLTSVERNGEVLKFNFSVLNPTEATMTISLSRDSRGLRTLARNSTGETFRAIASSAPGDRIEIRARERSSFYLSASTKGGSSIGTVNLTAVQVSAEPAGGRGDFLGSGTGSGAG